MLDFIVPNLIALRNEGIGGQILMTGMFAFGAMVFAPRPILCAISGWIFGFSSVVPILVGWTLGSVMAFLLARHLLQRQFQRRIEASRLHYRLNRIIEAEGFKIVLLLRIASPIPGTLLSYGCGLTTMSPNWFGLASLLGIIPQVLLFVFVGTTVFEITNENSLREFNIILAIAGLIMFSIVTISIRNKLKKY